VAVQPNGERDQSSNRGWRKTAVQAQQIAMTMPGTRLPIASSATNPITYGGDIFDLTFKSLDQEPTFFLVVLWAIALSGASANRQFPTDIGLYPGIHHGMDELAARCSSRPMVHKRDMMEENLMIRDTAADGRSRTTLITK